jgi:hypothetical protein
MVTS